MALLKLFAIFVTWANLHGLPIVVTSVNDETPRMFQTHKEFRAVDISVRGWSMLDIIDALEYFKQCQECQKLGAISAYTGKSTPLVYHHGTGWHFHLQVRGEAKKKMYYKRRKGRRRKR